MTNGTFTFLESRHPGSDKLDKVLSSSQVLFGAQGECNSFQVPPS